MNGMESLASQRVPQEPFHPFSHVKVEKKVNIHESRCEFLPGPESAVTPGLAGAKLVWNQEETRHRIRL